MSYSPDAFLYQPIQTEKLSYLGRARLALGTVGLAGAMMLTPEVAAADDTVSVSSARESMSPRQVLETCREDIRVVAHESSDPNRRTKFSVNTMEWMRHEINKGHNIIEVDAQVTTDGTFFGFHDRLLNANTRNGHGVAHQKHSRYIQKLRTNTGDRISDADDLISVLQRNPDVKLQHEFKDYNRQWTSKRLKEWYQKFSEAGVLAQINVSSASPRIIQWFSSNTPEVTDKQFIGFENHLPSLGHAKRIEATQVNVTSEAGLRNNAQYLKRAKSMGLRTSVRSRPSGHGDDGITWLRAIQNGVDQIVTQGPTKSFVCKAVSKAARR